MMIVGQTTVLPEVGQKDDVGDPSRQRDDDAGERTGGKSRPDADERRGGTGYPQVVARRVQEAQDPEDEHLQQRPREDHQDGLLPRREPRPTRPQRRPAQASSP